MIPAVRPSSILAERYRIETLLGEGGMGRVYRAQDLRTGEPCALKTLHRSRLGHANLVRFKREFRAASRLDHPHCLRVLSLEQAEDGWFYTMEFAPGGHLEPAAFARLNDLVPMALQILAALDHIHAKRIVHRDLKPENVLLGSELGGGLGAPQIKVADFGISKTFDTEDAELGGVMGSLAYLAPEQLDGYADPRSDLCALGLMLYEALAGEHPLAFVRRARSQRSPGDVGAYRTARRASVIEPLNRVAPHLPRALAELVTRLCAAEPDHRPTTAAWVYDELAGLWDELAVAPSGRPRALLSRASYLASPRLCGRERERTRLEDFFACVDAGAATGEPFLCFVEGEAGAGKSRLVSQLIRLAEERGAHLETGTWREEPGGPWPLRSLFQLAALDRFAGELTLAEGDTGWLVSSTGGLQRPATRQRSGRTTLPLDDSDPERGVAADPESKRWRVYRQIADELIQQARQQTLLLVLEDAHWADLPSLELLSFILRSAAQARASAQPPRVGIVVTHRPASDHEGLGALKDLAEQHEAALKLDLGPLDAQATTEMVASMLMSPAEARLSEFAARIWQQAAGNPLYVSQALHLLLASGSLKHDGLGWDLGSPAVSGGALPRSVREAIGERAARLSADTKRVLALGAVIGRQFALELAEWSAELEPALLLDCLDEGIRAEFLAEHPDRPGVYQFVHDHIRDALLAGLKEDDLTDLHRRVAVALEGSRGEAPDAAADLAHHHGAAGNHTAALAAHTRAARFAKEAYSFASAADHYAAALTLSEQTGLGAPRDLLEPFADVCVLSGRYEQALDAYGRCLASEARPLARAELLRRAAEAEFRRGNTERAGEQLENVLRELGFPVPERSPSLYGRLGAHLALNIARTLWPRHGSTNRPVQPAALRGQRLERRDLVARTCFRLAEVFYFIDVGRSYFYNLAGLNLAESLGPSTELAIGLSQQAFLLSSVGLTGLGARCLQRARAKASFSLVDQAWECLMHGMSLGCAGDAAGYAAEARKAEQLITRSREPMRLRQAWTLGGEALLSLGALAEAERNGLELLRLADEVRDDRGRGWGLRLRAHVASRRAEHARARSMFEEAAHASEQGGDACSRLLVQSRWAFDLLLTGQLDDALALAWPAADEYARRKLRHPSSALEGILLASAALKQLRDGQLPKPLGQVLREARWVGRFTAHTIRLSAPLYFAGCAAHDVARGRPRQGRILLQRAIDSAEQHRLQGDLLDVLSLAALVFPGPEGEALRRRAQALRAQLG
jgi:tetratricopeptide (TPR) repeat protein